MVLTATGWPERATAAARAANRETRVAGPGSRRGVCEERVVGYGATWSAGGAATLTGTSYLISSVIPTVPISADVAEKDSFAGR